MTTHANAGLPPAAPPAPPAVRVRCDPAGSFAGIAALGAAFAGFVSYGRSPDLLSTAFAVAITFFGAFLALLVLHVVFRLTLAVAKVAVPVAALLMVGCALEWPWAVSAVDWLRAAGSHGLVAAERGLEALQAR